MDELTADLYRKNPVQILLTGFMGCGKSTLGKALSKKLGVGFADLDDEIVAAAGKPIPEIFKTEGEAGFRTLETRVAEQVLARPGSAVVAAGGGLPTLAASREAVRRTNTLVVFLDAPFDALWRRIGGGTTRPLATSREETKARFEQRAPLYRSFCDIAVDVDPGASPDANAQRIASVLRASL
jgi:shikimate kinase